MMRLTSNNHRIIVDKNKFNKVVVRYYNYMSSKTEASFVFNDNHQLIIDFIFLSDFKSLLKSTEMFDWKWLEGSLYLLTLNDFGKLKLL